MRIEKVNENQIRCTLTKEDLQQRNLRISELAYGTDKAKILFRDMMQQAAVQFGFDAENIPLMIEAIPMSTDCIVLIVTKVENPEELDTRYSNFAPSIQDEALPPEERGSGVLEQLLNSIKGFPAEGTDAGNETPILKDTPAESRGANPENKDASQAQSGESAEVQRMRQYFITHRLFLFASVGDAADAAGLIGDAYEGRSALYYNDRERLYYLVLVFEDQEAVRKQQNVLTILSEYGTPDVMSYAREQFLREHCEVILPEAAMENLVLLS